MKKNGFTLIELLAVIVVLAIILVIAVPQVLNTISESKKGAFQSDAKLVLQQVEYQGIFNKDFDISTISKENFNDTLGLSDENYSDVTVGIVNTKLYVILIGQSKWEGLKACGTKQNMLIVNIDDTTSCENISPVLASDYDEVKGVNKPRLVTGMIPIKWNGTTWVDTTTTDVDWYNYTTTDKQWANARTADGSMWVWIPRYAYQIATNYHTNTTGTINIKFLKNITNTASDDTAVDTTTVYSGSSQTNYIKHPAFTFGATELTGIWVAKFEPSNDGSNNIKIVPNAKSWRSLKIGDMFINIRSMETNNVYGWGTTGTGFDTHLMKNAEWGAIAYLSKSDYGKNAQIWINNSSTSTTGCAGSSVSATLYSGCQYGYTTVNGLQASTTGNIYGIYDISGGAWEATTAYVNNSYAETNGSSIVNADNKYKTIYTVTTDTQANNYTNAIDIKGDAVYETSRSYTGTTSWYADNSNMPYSSSSWFIRGGYYGYVEATGAFHFNSYAGAADPSVSFRVVIVPSD